MRNIHDMGRITKEMADLNRRALRKFMDERGLKALPWAKEANVAVRSIGNFLDGRSQTLDHATLQALAKAANATVEDIIPSVAAKPQGGLSGVDNIFKTVAAPNEQGVPSERDGHLHFLGPRDLRILGYAKAGELGFFIDNDKRQGVTVRPEALRDVIDAYAVRVHDDTMMRALRPGRLLFVDPSRPTNPGDIVIIQMMDGQCFVKELVRRTEKFTVCLQYNPEQEVKFDPKKVRAMHLVVQIATVDI